MAAEYKPYVLADTPIAYWRLDNYVDSSPNGNNLAVLNSGPTNGGQAPLTTSIDAANSTYFAANGYLGTGGASTPPVGFTGLTSFTIVAWVKIPTTGFSGRQYMNVVGKMPLSGAVSTREMNFYVYSSANNGIADGLHFSAPSFVGSSAVSNTGVNLADGNPHMIAVSVANDGTHTYYIDDQKVGSSVQAATWPLPNSHYLTVGGIDNRYLGHISEVSIHPVVLSDLRLKNYSRIGRGQDPEAQAAAGGGGGAGAGSGNMLGAFALGSTMLGADAGSGGGSGGGSGSGNMLGAFALGSTMLGADPGGGGGGDAPPINVGAIHQATATIAGLANVSGAFATFVFPVTANVAGDAVVQNAYLNSNWPLEATTVVTSNGTTIFTTTYPTGSQLTPTSGQIQGVRAQTGTWYFKVGTSTGTNTYGTAYKTSIVTGVESTISGFGSGGATSFSWDAGADHYISRVDLTDVSGRLVARWGWNIGPGAEVFATIFSPIGLRSEIDAGSTVTGDMSLHILRGNRIDGEATVEGEAYRVIPLKPQGVLANCTVVADLQNVKDLYADAVGEATVTSELVLTDVVFGTSEVTGYLETHNTRGRANAFATVVANMRRNEGFQGDCIGDSDVVADPYLQMLLAAISDGFATAKGDLTFPAPLTGGQADGSANVTGLLAIYNLKGTVESDSTVVGHFGYAGPITMRGTSAGETTIDFSMRVRGRFTATTINGDSTVTCPAIIRVWFVDGTAAGDSTVAFDTLTIHFPAPGPVEAGAEVEGHLTHDARYGGEIEGEGKVLPTFPYVETTVGTGTSQGTTDTRGRLYVRPQDFEPSTSDGTAAVLGQVLVSFLSLKGASVGGRIHLLTPQGAFTSPPQYNDVLVKGALSAKAPFAPVTIKGFAEFERAILLLNDSGLVTGQARLEAFLDFKTGVGEGQSRGYSINRGQFELASDLRGVVTNAWAGVGKWFPNGFNRIYHFDASLTMAPYPDSPEHTGKPGNAEWHGASHPQGGNRLFGVSSDQNATRDTWRDGNEWDGSYEDWTLNDMKGLDWRLYPELWDPDLSASMTNPNQAQPYRTFPGPLRRKYALLQRGVLGTWMVDTRGPGFLDKAMRATPVGEARFDEPQSTVDMDLELKSSMKGRIFGYSEVTAVALLLSFRKFLQEGNVTALRHLTKALAGNAAKSPEALVPMTRDKVELLNPVRPSNAMYV